MHCFARCPTEDVVAALGLKMRDLFDTDDAWNSHTTLEWADPSTGEFSTQTRHYTGKSKYLVEPGTETKTLVYPARHDPDATRPILWNEGAKAAKSAALKLPADDFDVVGFFSASTIPNAATLAKIAKGRPCIVWPDDDEAGAKAGQRLVSDLLKAGADDVVTIDPARLGIQGGHGDDAEQWHPGDSPSEKLRAACVAAKPADVEHEHFRSIWTWAAEPVPNVLIPGLAWRGRVSKIAAAPKLGKTSLLINGISAWQEGREFLGEPTGPKGSVLYVSETGPPVLRAWLEQYGCPTDAPIIAGGAAKVDDIAEAARKHKPDLVVIDSVTDLHAATDASKNMWNAGDVRKLLQPLRELECAVILVHHVRKSDGKPRDSGDFEAAPDMNVSFDPGSSYGGGVPPPGDRRLRYSGRWSEPERTLTFDTTDGYALKKPTGGNGPTGEGDPFTAHGPAPTMLDETVNGYIMQHAESSGRQIRAALGCQQRELQPSLARLSVAGQITSKEGPRKAKLWSVATSGSPTGSPIFEPDEPDEPDNENGGKPDKLDRPVQLVQTLTKETPEPDEPDDLSICRGTDRPVHDIGSSGEQRLPLALAKVTTAPTPRGGSDDGNASIDVLPIPAPEMHSIRADLDAQNYAPQDSELTPAESTPSADPLLDGEIEDGENTEQTDKTGAQNYAPTLDRSRPAPEVHSSGIKKWDDATSTWVDTLPGGDVFTVEGGIVHLSDRTTVTDGDPNIHWDMAWTDIELDREGMVH